MDLQSAEISPVTLVSRESAAISVAMESSLAADVATLISDDGSGRRAFPIEIEVQRMSCPRCQYTFPVGFYCTKCGYVPADQENRRSRNVCNEQQTD